MKASIFRLNLFAIGIILSMNTYAQEVSNHKFLFAITTGAGLSTCRYIYNSVSPPPITSFRIVPTGGIGFDWRMGKVFSLQFNTLYKGKGDKIDMSKWIDQIFASDTTQSNGKIIAEGYIETRLAYVEASLIPTFTIANRIEIGAGVFAGYGLSGEEKSKYTIKYENFEIPFPDESYDDNRKVNYFLLSPEEIIENELYVNRIDYGYYGHLGLRFNPFKISLGVSYSKNSREPDSKFTDIFIETYDRNYNLTGIITLSWYPGAR